jgi:hypothetical protein
MNINWHCLNSFCILQPPHNKSIKLWFSSRTYSTSQKCGHTYSFKGFFLYYDYLLHCRIIVTTSKLWNNTWNHVVTKEVLNKSKYKAYLRFFKVATLCLDDSFAHSWHSLNQLHKVVTWNAFQLTGVPCYKLICGISFLLNWVNQLCCDKVGMVYRR